MIQQGMRLYYDNKTGNVFFEVSEQNHYGEAQTVERDIETIKLLSERNRDTFDVKELAFGERASEFASCIGYYVDVKTGELIFTYPNPDDPQTPVVAEKSLPVQIAELKAENEVLKTENVELKERDATIQNDQLYILETLIEKGIIE